MIDAEKDFQVVAVAADGEMAVQLARTFRPDIIIMDINMPKLNGVEATRRITHIVPDVCIIGLSVQEDPKVAHLMHKAGASATLSKGIAFNILCDTIRALFHTRDRTAPPESDRSASV